MRLKDRIALITGGAAGIGLATAQKFAAEGARVVIGDMNEPAGREALQTLGPDAAFYKVNVADRAEVQRWVDAVLARYGRIDVLVNNAGAFNNQRLESPDGIELTFALNHLSYFLLTNLLLDALKAAPAARIVSVSSGAHVGGQLNFDDLENRRSYSGWNAYSQSKLANLYFTYELARRLAGTTVTANALHPGFVATQFGLNNGGLLAVGMKLVQRFAARTPEKGAETSIYLASAPEVAGVTGKYFADKKALASSPVSYDEAAAKRLWAVSEEMTGLRVKA